jgi:hypothetical protein
LDDPGPYERIVLLQICSGDLPAAMACGQSAAMRRAVLAQRAAVVVTFRVVLTLSLAILRPSAASAAPNAQRCG